MLRDIFNRICFNWCRNKWIPCPREIQLFILSLAGKKFKLVFGLCGCIQTSVFVFSWRRYRPNSDIYVLVFLSRHTH